MLPKFLYETLFSFQGRVGRLSYLARTLAVGSATLVLLLGSFAVWATMNAAGLVLMVIVFASFIVATTWSLTALTCRRLHDMNLSGRHALWIFAVWCAPGQGFPPNAEFATSLAGLSIAFWLLFAPGRETANRFRTV